MSAPPCTIIAASARLAALAGGVDCAAIRMVIYDLRRDLDWALGQQATGVASGRRTLFVGVEPGLVQIGPQVGAGQAGCLRCWHVRRQANHPSPRYAAQYPARPDDDALQPLLPAAGRLLRDLLRAAAGALDPCCYIRVRTDTLAVSRHRFLPVSGCAHCPAPAPDAANPFDGFPRPRRKAAARDKRIANPLLTLDAARAQFVDRHSGLVRHVFQDPASDLMPLCCAEMAPDAPGPGESGYGRADNFRQSELVAILEAVERYAGRDARGAQVSLRASVADLMAAWPGQVADPERFILHTGEQPAHPHFALARYTRALPFRWCWAHSLRGGGAVLVPEQLVYYDQRARPHEPPDRFVFDSSNGCSLGGCLEEAALGGLYELVERDAYFCTWYTRIARPRIINDSIRERRAAALIARAGAQGMHIHLFDITTDIGIPAVWAMIVDPAPDAVVKSYCASGCHGNWDEAVLSALVEVTTSIGVYRRSLGAGRARAYAMLHDSDQVRAMPDHVLLYSLPESYARLAFLHGGPRVTLQQCEARLASSGDADLSDELRRQSARVLAVASDLLIVDQSFAGLDPLGLRCAKVLAPGLLPVTFGQQYRRISYARLNQVAHFWGVDAEFTPANVNPWPHNFP